MIPYTPTWSLFNDYIKTKKSRRKKKLKKGKKRNKKRNKTNKDQQEEQETGEEQYQYKNEYDLDNLIVLILNSFFLIKPKYLAMLFVVSIMVATVVVTIVVIFIFCKFYFKFKIVTTVNCTIQ
jgi:uncharacterized membrane protein